MMLKFARHVAKKSSHQCIWRRQDGDRVTAVFVNGNPETSAIWDSLLSELDRRDTLRLSPPGFGAPIPDGFPCTGAAYRDWLISALEALGRPVDLVGHDVGGSTVLRVAMARPDLLRSWVSDSLGTYDPDYVWHERAQSWQSPETGESAVASLLGGTLSERVERLAGLGIPESIAEQIAPAQGPQMQRAVLGYYRAAIQPAMAELGRNLPAASARPGLAIVGTADNLVGSQEMRVRSAARAGAQVARFEGLGHWWMVQDPGLAATTLRSFWSSVGGSNS
jgi:pimeloyl-ACP methyl ester carboxylesterase